MRRLKKALLVGAAATMVMGMSVGVWAAGPENLAGTLTEAKDFVYNSSLTTTKYSYPSGLEIQNVNYTPLYTNSTASDSELVSTISSITVKDLSDNSIDTIPVDTTNKTAVLVVGGVQRDIVAGTTYSDASTITLLQKNQVEWGFSKFDGVCANIYYYNTAAAVIKGNVLQEGYSATDAITGGTYDGSSASDISINSQGGFFGGFYLVDTNYSINRLNMTLNGNGGDDFQGWGAGLTVTDNANLNLSNSYIDTTGVIRTAIWVGGDNSSLTADNVVVDAHNNDSATPYSTTDNYTVPMMEKVPYALGLTGNIRATNVLGSGTATYRNSLIVSDVWGALSTDSGTEGTTALNVSNTLSGIGYIEEAQVGKTYTATKTVNGKTYGFTIGTLGQDSGYVTYADAGVRDNFTNVSFYAPDYIGIIASKTSNMHFTDSYGYSDRIGFLIHQNNGTADNGGGLYIDGGSYDVADSFVMVKGGSINGAYTYTNVDVDGADVNVFGDNAQSGVFFQLIQNDDAGNPGATSYTIDDLTYDEMKDYTPDDGSEIVTVDPTTATFSNMTIKGDIYNSVAKVSQDLNVTLENDTINGAISSSYAYHVDTNGNQVNDVTIGADDYLQIGRVANTAMPSIRNNVNLTLVNTTWNVTKVSYLTSLTVDSTSTINGTVEKLSDGTYKVSPKEAAATTTVSPATGESSIPAMVVVAICLVCTGSAVVLRRKMN